MRVIFFYEKFIEMYDEPANTYSSQKAMFVRLSKKRLAPDPSFLGKI